MLFGDSRSLTEGYGLHMRYPLFVLQGTPQVTTSGNILHLYSKNLYIFDL